MNALGIALLWSAVQVTVVAAVCALLYLWVRRRSAAGAAVVALSGLLVSAGLSLASLSPWPHWELSREPAHIASLEAAAPPSTSDADTTLQRESPAAPGSLPQMSVTDAAGDSQFLENFWSGLARALEQTPAPAPEADARWPAVVAGLVLAAAVLGLVRLLLGLLAVASYRRRSRPVTDRGLLEQVDLLRAELGCRRPVKVVETAALVTAATTGWRSPMILLPLEWRAWTALELRAVLAHELAHIARHDFLASTCGELTRALHFYHPLVHWLAGRMRLEQELAADAAAAALSGGQRPYLTTLAEMALRQSDRSPGWPARTFLPTRGTFLRRIEMLRDARVRDPARSRSGWLSAAVLVLCGIGVAGVRLPAAGDAVGAEAAQPPAIADQGRQPARPAEPAGGEGAPIATTIEWRHIPGDAFAVAAIRPAAILRRPEMQQVARLLKDSPLVDALGIPLDQIEQVTSVMLPQPGTTQFVHNNYIVRASVPTDFAAMAAALVPNAQPAEYAGVTFHKGRSGGVCYYRPDERTIIFDTEQNLQHLILSGPRNKALMLQNEHWKSMQDADAALVVNLQSAPFAVTAPLQQAGVFAPLWEDVQIAYLGASIDEHLELVLLGLTESEAAAERVRETLSAALTLGKNQLRVLQQQMQRMPAPGTPQANIQPLMVRSLAMGQDVLNAASVERDGAQVRFTTAMEVEPSVIAYMSASVQAARTAAQQITMLRNLKQIAIAMHNHHDAHNHLPAASVLGRDGKTRHSWRVAILPFIDQNVLYEQYRFDEPWDSPHNLSLIEKMPAVYRSPGAPAGSTFSSYYVLTGPQTMFEGEKPVSLRQITDGTSNTLMVVEAKRDIPWTKPEDIPYDHTGTLPELGGFVPGVFHVALGDGSARSYQQSIPEAVLRALITKAGGEAIYYDDKRQPIRASGGSPDGGSGEGGADAAGYFLEEEAGRLVPSQVPGDAGYGGEGAAAGPDASLSQP